MKQVISYLFTPLLICVYIATNQGFEIHACSMEDTSKLFFYLEDDGCHHGEKGCHDVNCIHGSCHTSHDDLCCQTTLYILDEAKIKAMPLEIKQLTTTSDILFQPITCNLTTSSYTASVDIITVKIVLGPDGGIISITPLRL